MRQKVRHKTRKEKVALGLWREKGGIPLLVSAGQIGG
jgi:hypothetical protein